MPAREGTYVAWADGGSADGQCREERYTHWAPPLMLTWTVEGRDHRYVRAPEPPEGDMQRYVPLAGDYRGRYGDLSAVQGQ